MVRCLLSPCVASLAFLAAVGFVGACRNTVVEELGDAGPADGGDGNDADDGGVLVDAGPCPRAGAPALSVQVLHGETGFTLCGEVTVTVVDGNFRAAGTPTGTGEACRHLAADGRPGTYTVTATGPGFQTAALDELTVAADDCDDPSATRQVTLTLLPQ
jgi:hypothetical protein